MLEVWPWPAAHPAGEGIEVVCAGRSTARRQRPRQSALRAWPRSRRQRPPAAASRSCARRSSRSTSSAGRTAAAAFEIRARRAFERDEDRHRDREDHGRRGGPEQRAGLRAPPHLPDRVLVEGIAQYRQAEGSSQETEPDASRQIVAHVLGRDHEHGPVPEVEGVRAVADVAETARARAQPRGAACRMPRRSRAPRRPSAAGRRSRGRASTPRTPPRRRRCTPGRASRAATATASRQRARRSPAPRRARAPRREWPSSSTRRSHRSPCCGSTTASERAGRDEHDPAQPRGRRQARRREHSAASDRQRPDEVELLLDRERPEVLHGRGRLQLREVVAALAREVHVRHEERRPDAVADRLARAHEVQQLVRDESVTTSVSTAAGRMRRARRT